MTDGIARDDKAPWVVAYDSTSAHGKPPCSCECQRCGTTEVYQLPIELGEWVRRMRAFLRVHRKCRERP